MTISKRLGLAAALALAGLAPAHAKDPVAPPALQKEFDAFIAKFRAAVKADDPAAVAAMSKLPFMSDASVSTAEQFRDMIYKADFQKKDRACIQRVKPIYDRNPLGEDNFSITCGDVYFLFTKTPQGFLLSDVGVNDLDVATGARAPLALLERRPGHRHLSVRPGGPGQAERFVYEAPSKSLAGEDFERCRV